jgi:hypothetical protein
MSFLLYIGGLLVAFSFGFVLCALIQAGPPRVEAQYEFTREDLEFLEEAHISDE